MVLIFLEGAGNDAKIPAAMPLIFDVIFYIILMLIF